MAGANGVTKYLNCDRNNAVPNLKHIGAIYKTPQTRRIVGSNISALDITNDIMFDNNSISPLTGPTALQIFNQLSNLYKTNPETEWTIEIRNEDAVQKVINLPGFTPNSITVPANTTGDVTFRVLTTNPPTYEIIQNPFASSGSLPAGAILGDVLYYDGTAWVPYPGAGWLTLPWSATATQLNDPPVYWRGTMFKSTVPKGYGEYLSGPIDWTITELARNGGALNELANIVSDFNIPTVGSIALQDTFDFYWELNFDIHFGVNQNWINEFYNLTLVDYDTGASICGLRTDCTAESLGINQIARDYNVTTRLPLNTTHFAINFLTLTGSTHGDWTPCDVTINMIITKRRWIH